MDCIVVAGGVPGPDDPLYEYTQGKPKALLDMEGRTMLERVMDALQTSQNIDRIVVVGLGSDMGMHFLRPVDMHLTDRGGMVSNVLAGVEWLRQDKPDIDHVLYCTSDIPTISGTIVDEFVRRCQPLDRNIYYILVTQEAMEKRFPHSNRTYVKFKGVDGAGGDMAIARAALADSHQELWEALTNARKHAWKLARIVGFGTLIKYLLRQLSLDDVEKTAERIINGPVGIVVDPPAELAMDADKPQQVDMLREELRRMDAAG
ncbi:MAG: nucleotidyltransferase family protein [Candidatus Promineifilaceae bacterium]|jgi:GTP:adenosylcobinamide-phosphate guanylyltransferase